MNLRKITSMTMLVSFVLCVLTSIILYIVPHGRVAYWADWRLWGLSKSQWSDLHINLGFLFLIAGFLHLYYNWNIITAYMKNKAREIKVVTPSFNVALLITLIVGIGTYFQVPPLSTVINFGESFKEAAAEKYGEPPYGHAELSSLKIFVKKVGLDLEKSKELFKTKKISFDNDQQSIGEIAAINGMTPNQLHQLMKSIAPKKKQAQFPDSPFPGFGRKMLADICKEYGLTVDDVLQGLAGKNITATAEQTVKEIASGADMDPHAFFEVLHDVVQKK